MWHAGRGEKNVQGFGRKARRKETTRKTEAKGGRTKNSRLTVNADWYIRSNQINKETDILPVSEEVRNHNRR
jgi:hypothetical protein